MLHAAGNEATVHCVLLNNCWWACWKSPIYLCRWFKFCKWNNIILQVYIISSLGGGPNFQRGPIFCSKYQKISSGETKSEESVFTMSTLVNNLAEPDFRV